MRAVNRAWVATNTVPAAHASRRALRALLSMRLALHEHHQAR
jgi:hypothetical protein